MEGKVYVFPTCNADKPAARGRSGYDERKTETSVETSTRHLYSDMLRFVQRERRIYREASDKNAAWKELNSNMEHMVSVLSELLNKFWEGAQPLRKARVESDRNLALHEFLAVLESRAK